MTRFIQTSSAAFLLLAASVTFPAAQVSGGGSSSGSSSGGSVGGSVSSSPGSGSSSSVTGAPPVSAPSSTPTSVVPSPATDPNNQVAPSVVGLPGGGDSVPQSPGSGIGSHVPVYGTRDASVPSVGGSINQSEQRSSSTDCTGTGTKSSTGSGSTSTTTSSCATGSGGLGTNSIMGGSGAIDVNR